MSPRNDRVREALDRWEAKGMLPPEVGARLRAEAEEERARSGRRLSQYALAATGALVLVVAVGVLADWLWPLMGAGARSVVLAALGVGVHALGTTLEARRGWRPAGYLLQTAGLVVLLGAFLHSEERWADASAGGVVVGVLSLVTPILAAPRALRRNAVMPAVHLALAFAFLAVFLHRATNLSADTIIWILDGVMVVTAVLLVLQLARSRDVRAPDCVLYAFVAALYTTLVLLVATGLGPLGLRDDTVWAVDVWLAVVVILSLWGIHGAPRALRRDWFEGQLAACVLMAIPLGFVSGEAMNASEEVSALLVGGVGALGMTYGIRRGAASVLKASALALVVATWYYGVSRAGALGAVLALGITAGVLFWLSKRVGGDEDEDGAR